MMTPVPVDALRIRSIAQIVLQIADAIQVEGASRALLDLLSDCRGQVFEEAGMEYEAPEDKAVVDAYWKDLLDSVDLPVRDIPAHLRKASAPMLTFGRIALEDLAP
jgi:hypothetical protein